MISKKKYIIILISLCLLLGILGCSRTNQTENELDSEKVTASDFIIMSEETYIFDVELEKNIYTREESFENSKSLSDVYIIFFRSNYENFDALEIYMEMEDGNIIYPMDDEYKEALCVFYLENLEPSQFRIVFKTTSKLDYFALTVTSEEEELLHHQEIYREIYMKDNENSTDTKDTVSEKIYDEEKHVTDLSFIDNIIFPESGFSQEVSETIYVKDDAFKVTANVPLLPYTIDTFGILDEKPNYLEFETDGDFFAYLSISVATDAPLDRRADDYLCSSDLRASASYISMREDSGYLNGYEGTFRTGYITNVFYTDESCTEKTDAVFGGYYVIYEFYMPEKQNMQLAAVVWMHLNYLFPMTI